MLFTDSVPHNICILRVSAIGDVINVVPVVRAIQEQSVDTKITWVCGKPEHKILAGIEGVRFVILDKTAGLRGYRDLKRELAGEQFDVLLHMQTSVRANLASTCIRAAIRLGWDKSRSRELHQFFVNRQIQSIAQQHQAQGFLSFARALGLQANEPHWDLPVSQASKEFANKILPGEQATLLISACSSHALRNWSAQRYAAIADYAIDNLAMRVLLTGGSSELEASMGKAIAQSMVNEPINLIGKDTLAQFLALLQQTDVVLSPDSGPLHLANALGKPVIGLYACTYSRRSGPYNSLDLCVDKFTVAARRFLNKNPQDLRWGTRIERKGVMNLIQVEEVIEQLEKAIRYRGQK